MQQGDYEAAIAASQAVLDSGTADPVQRDHALLNLMTLYYNYGDGERALALAERLLSTEDPNLRSIAEATVAMLRAHTAADIEAVNRRLRAMARDQKPDRSHHFAVTMSNLAMISIMQDRLQDALRELEEALVAFGPAPGLIERASAIAGRAQVLSRLGQLGEAEELFSSLADADSSYEHHEVYIEAADAMDSFGSRDMALAFLDRVGHLSTVSPADMRLLSVVSARLDTRRRRFDSASAALRQYPPGLSTLYGHQSAHEITVAYLKVSRGDIDAGDAVSRGLRHAATQGVHGMRRVGEVLRGVLDGPEALSQAVLTIGPSYPWHLTFLADVLAPRLSSISAEALLVVAKATKLHPERWRADLRVTLKTTTRQPHGLPQVCLRILVTTPISLACVTWPRVAAGLGVRRIWAAPYLAD